MTTIEKFLQKTGETAIIPFGSRVGVAISGGSDSMALLHLLNAISDRMDLSVYAYTVDHGLRPEAADEARRVAEICVDLDLLPHETLVWEEGKNWSGGTNLQAAAREARYDLLAEAAKRDGIDCMCIGHTMDDQAETVLMRLGRQSGTKGLAAMKSTFHRQGVSFCRPLMDFRREELRDYLRALGVDWIDDPSNENDSFDRIKARKLLAGDKLSDLGITVENLAAVAAHMQDAEETLEYYARQQQKDYVANKFGAAIVPMSAFLRMHKDAQRRILLSEMRKISGFKYPPRQDKIDAIVDAMNSGKKATFYGCLFIPKKVNRIPAFVICREPRAVKSEISENGRWDGRWELPDGIQGKAGTLSREDMNKLDFDTYDLPKEVFDTCPVIFDDAGNLAWSSFPIRPHPILTC